MAATAAALFVSFWILIGLSILVSDLRAYRRQGPLHRRPTVVAELRDGDAAKVVGTVRLAAEELCAPLSGRSCAGYEMRWARRRRLGWNPVRVERRAAGFYLDDGTGEVYVPLERAEMALTTDVRFTEGRRRAPRNVRAVLRELREHLPGRYRCDEGAILEGSRVAVYGVFHREPDPRIRAVRDYRSKPYRFVAEPQGLHVSDDRAALG